MANESNPSDAEKVVKKIDVKKAVQIATNYFFQLYPQLQNAGVMLEEVEETEDGSFWLITMGFDVKVTAPPFPTSIAHVFGPTPSVIRNYKVIKIESKTGRIISMKIRSLK